MKSPLKVTEEIILTAGPSITTRELEYVADATLNGWNHHHSNYIKLFEEHFASYIGVKYAMATSSCTGALHLALLAMGIGTGDEVIVPETTWIATVSAIKYVGATPVFADIEPDTWVMDTESVTKRITCNTKVIIPVHLYGHPVDMEPLVELAINHGIDILEDAAPSIGALYKGRKTGSFGRAAVFSFQGAKALVTGEGGILVSNDKEFIERARFFGDHGRDPNKTLYNIIIGYKYKMSNLQAALGLAQIERVEEIVDKKRQIFRWYQERLDGVGDFKLNVERSWARNIFWMSSIVLGDSISLSRDEFIRKLKDRNIDSRPFFYPISSFPMFKDVTVSNPVAYKIPLRGVNLPSGYERTEEEIDYICAHILDILGYSSNKISKIQPDGWMAYRDNLYEILKEYKSVSNNNIEGCYLLVKNEQEELLGKLRPITKSHFENEQVKKILNDACKISVKPLLPLSDDINIVEAKYWLRNEMQEIKDYIVFIIEDNDGIPCGYLGLSRFDYKRRSCEISDIGRSINNISPGFIKNACSVFINWVFGKLGVENIYLRVTSDNDCEIQLAHQLKFKEIQRTPLMKIATGNKIRWINVMAQPYCEVERYYISYKLSKSVWQNNIRE